MTSGRPVVSIILPTYNRAPFLDEAFESIRQQTLADWNLIVVDDGSTDDTAAVVERWKARLPDLIYVRQDNRGAYGARNTGLNQSTGDFVAFFDSDDLWLPHHLERSVAAFKTAPELDWVYAACRSVDASGREVQPTTFAHDGRPQAFLSASAQVKGPVHVVEPGTALLAQLRGGLYAGLQNSVIRRQVFEGQRFWDDYRVVEDVLFLVRALSRGLRVGYLTDVHVIYRIHEGNSSASAAGLSFDNLRRICLETVTGLERIRAETPMPDDAAADLRRALAHSYFWRLGYSCCWQAGDVPAALEAMRAGRRLAPRDPAMLKTYLACLVRAPFRKRRPA